MRDEETIAEESSGARDGSSSPIGFEEADDPFSRAETKPDFQPGPQKWFDESEWSEGSEWIDGRYEVLRLLGQGAVGKVYEVRDTELEQLVALKLLHARLRDDEEVVQRFRREARLARRITHGSVVRVFDFGRAEEGPYLTMESLEGRDLEELLRREAPFRRSRLEAVVDAVCSGLRAAHEQGVLHGDLKPQNVIVEPAGRVVVTDFGLARQIRAATGAEGDEAGSILGTPKYLAPEQISAELSVDGRADQYALGILMYEMATGEFPWEEESSVALMHARWEYPAPSVPTDCVLPDRCRRVVERALRRDPDERFESVAALQAQLREAPPVSTEGLSEVSTVEHSDATELDKSDTIGLEESSAAYSVLVLPFEDDGEARPYLSDGLLEQLVDDLSRRSDLRPVPTRVVERALAPDEDTWKIGEELGADILVSGAVEPAEDGVSITVEVFSVEDRIRVTRTRFDVEPSEILEVVRTAGDTIERSLGMAPGERAIELYFRARTSMQEHWYDDVCQAVEWFESARELKPEDPRILAGLAKARARAAYLDPGEAEAHLRDARDCANAAIENADHRAEPHVALATAHYYKLRYREALRALRRALGHETDHVEAHDLMGRILVECGDLEAGVRHLTRVQELNPYLYRSRWDLAKAYALRGRWGELEALLAKPVDRNHAARLRWMVASRYDLWRRDGSLFDETGGEPEGELHVPSDSPHLFEIAGAVDDSGTLTDRQRRALEESLDRENETSRQILLTYQLYAEIAARGGDGAYLETNLDRAVRAGLRDLNWLEHCPLFEPYREAEFFADTQQTVRDRVDAIFG